MGGSVHVACATEVHGQMQEKLLKLGLCATELIKRGMNVYMYYTVVLI